MQHGISPGEAASLTEMLLNRLNTSHTDDSNSMKCCELRQRRVEQFAGTDHYRLFFLLEGKYSLKVRHLENTCSMQRK